MQVIQGDALAVLKTLPPDHFHCVVTSPPYWGLRDYGTGTWEGGDPACGHVEMCVGMSDKNTLGPNGYLPETNAANVGRKRAYRDICGKCGARRIDQQIGLEQSPDEWCARLVEVFREVRRVLRADGVCFVNIGDSYSTGSSGDRRMGDPMNPKAGHAAEWRSRARAPCPGMKPKDLVGQPWMLAFALRADGWWLRSEIIWAKPNPMPESVRDRPTKAHEQVFLLTKSPRYFYDAEAVREPHSEPWRSTGKLEQRGTKDVDAGVNNGFGLAGLMPREYNPAGRNLRSVWTIATDPLPSIEVDGEKLDHFASYPVELARRCILAGTSAKGCCDACGAPRARAVERESAPPQQTDRQRHLTAVQVERTGGRINGGTSSTTFGLTADEMPRTTTTGWRPTCSCQQASGSLGEPQPCRILDPFGGSGRTALAAEELGRDCTLIELNPRSVVMAKAQIERAKARRMIGDAERVPVLEGQMVMPL